MAFTEFYMQTTGNDLNAGSTNANAAVYTSTGGNWDGTSVFTPTDGSTPANSINVGDWVDVYNTGDTEARYIAQVTAVGAGVNGTVTVSTTVKFGTLPTSNSGSRNLKAGGAWASLALCASPGIFSTSGAVPVSLRINIKAGTYSEGATDRQFNLPGATTTPLWLRGYNSSIGDLENDWSTAPPLFAFGAGRFLVNAPHLIISNLSFTGTNAVDTAGVIQVMSSSLHCKLRRLRVENTNAAAASAALAMNTGSSCSLSRCWFKATSSATRVVWDSGGGNTYHGCTFRGGGHGFQINGAGSSYGPINFCRFYSNGNDGIRVTAAGSVFVACCSFYNPGSNGINFAVIPTNTSEVRNCIFANCGAFGINNSTGTNTNFIERSGNDYFSNASGNENGFGDSPAFYGQTETSSPYTNAAGDNLTLVSGANARNNGVPGNFENETDISYADIGAIRHQDPAGGGGVVFSPGMDGGAN